LAGGRSEEEEEEEEEAGGAAAANFEISNQIKSNHKFTLVSLTGKIYL